MPGSRFGATIRTQLTLAATLLTLLMLAGASVTIVVIQRRALTAAIDDSLRQRADNLGPAALEGKLPAEGDREDTFIQLIDGRGVVLGASNNIVGAAAAVPSGHHATFSTATVHRLRGRFRVYQRPVGAGSTSRFLVVAKNLDDVADSVRILTLSLAVACPTLALLLGVMAWWVTGRTLRPIRAIRREVQDIHGGELHRRVPVPPTDDEVADLARTMNDMLDRVETASLRQQEFVDDASHEFRTPLTRMQADLDVAIAHPDSEPAPVTLERLGDHVRELSALLDDLLFFARRATAPGPIDEVDVDDVVLRVAERARTRDGLAVDTTGVTAVRVAADARAIERAVSNLVENACRHARTTVAVSTTAADGRGMIIVDDDGPGIPPGERERVFERFTRLDESRSRSDGGRGLGLAIARDIAVRHGGEVTVEAAPLGGARLVLVIPEPPGSK